MAKRALTEVEIQQMIDKALAARFDTFKDEIKTLVGAQGPYLQQIATGAQSAMLLSVAMLGNPELGIQGFVGEVKDHLTRTDTALSDARIERAAINAKVDVAVKRGARMHLANLRRFRHLSKGQGYIRRGLDYLTGVGADGKPRWVAIGAMLTALAGALGWVTTHWPTIRGWGHSFGR